MCGRPTSWSRRTSSCRSTNCSRQLDELVAGEPPFRILLVSLCRRRRLQIAERDRRAAPDAALRRSDARARRKKAAATCAAFCRHQRGAALHAVPAAGQRIVCSRSSMPGRGEGALEPRDLSKPAHHAFQRNGIWRALRERARIASARSSTTIRKKTDQHRLSDRISHRGGGRCVAQPVLPARKRDDRRAQYHPGRYGRTVRRVRERSSARYEGRPHWGKRHTRTAEELACALSAISSAFRALRRKLDPQGKFLNPHLARYI